MNLQVCVATVLGLLCADTVRAWTVETKTDSMTDENRSVASLRSTEGHKFSVYRTKDGQVWGLFALADTGVQTLAPNNPPIFRVDKHDAWNIRNAKDLSELMQRLNKDTAPPSYVWEPKWVNFVLWHGNDAESRAPIIDQLATGKSIVVRYYLFTGGYKETTLAIKGGENLYRMLKLKRQRGSVD